jgi:uncharacterized protein YggE
MKKIAVVLGLLVAAAAAVAVLQPSGAGAVDPSATTDSVTVSGEGVVLAVPDRAEISAGVETRAQTAKAALQANATAMERVLQALRAGGGTDVTTQTVSLSTSFDNQGAQNGFVASNIASATVAFDKAGSLIDAAVAAGANTVDGPTLDVSDSDALYRQALKKAVDDARAKALALADAGGFGVGPITTVVEQGTASPPVYRPVAMAAKAADSTPVEAGTQDVTADVTVSFTIR